ncbi:hypothetical protein BKI52_09765 [marine bacterium AO1-C]|nr:hypothetical protein BKI52_09765 [marine bacterium AO1-C]
MLIIITSQVIFRGFESKSVRLNNNWVNIAGQNRMLSVKVLNLSQLVAQGEESYRKELNSVKQDIEFAIRTLKFGGKITINKQELLVPPLNPELLVLHQNLKKDWFAYNEQVSQISSKLYAQHDKLQQKQILLKAISSNEKFIRTGNEIIQRVIELNEATQTNRVFWRRFVLLSNVFILLYVLYIFWQYTLKPLQKLSEVSSKMVKGQLDQDIDIKQKDELGQIAEATNDLAYNLKEVRDFVEELGKGNYQVELEMEKKGRFIAEDSLFMTLITARNQLITLKGENEKQAWVSHGLAEIGHILSAGDIDIHVMGQKILSELIKLLSGNQGTIFLLQQEEEKTWLELIACYGIHEERIQQKKIPYDGEFGAGLIGQALIERGTIHQVGVTPEYFEVKLGAGEVKNGNLLIVPLIFNQTEVGVLEVGSFREFETHEIDFIEILADRIASTILNIQANKKTNRLLHESEEQKDILQAQEEEMRQNVEELRAIHEVMGKKQKELERQNQRIKSSELVLTKALKQLEEQKQTLENQKIDLEEANDVLHAQEEEMRQNVEELVATQESLASKSKNLERQNKLITTSIYYAQNIQQAILPSQEKLQRVLKDSFVIYRPKDIVSGDFYWMSKINDEKIVVAAVDCTGHGVPGAFMSMIGNTLLNQIVNEKKVTNPSEILKLLDKSVYEDLNQQKSSNREGMDVCLCTIEPGNEQTNVCFAGAKRSLYYTHEGELIEEKGDRFSIGGWQDNDRKSFISKEIKLNIGDRIYLSSDGFVDTPNPRRKSFGTKRFRKVLQDSIEISISEQRNTIEQALDQFQQDAEQRDDILLIGIEV